MDLTYQDCLLENDETYSFGYSQWGGSLAQMEGAQVEGSTYAESELVAYPELDEGFELDDASANLLDKLDARDGFGSLVQEVEDRKKDSHDQEVPVITVASARGGVGVSAVVSMMAVAASKWNMNVALLDFDLSFGNDFSYFALEGPADLAGYAQNPSWDYLKSHAQGVGSNLALYGPCVRPEYAETLTNHVSVLIQQLKRHHDVVLVDAGNSWNEAVAQLIQLSDRVALVCDERASAIGSLAKAASLAVRLGVARTRIVRIMNRCDMKRRDENFLARANVGLETAKVLKIAEGGYDVNELLGTGHINELHALEEPFSKSCTTAIARLFSELGILPDCKEAQRARDAKVFKRSGFFGFAREAV